VLGKELEYPVRRKVEIARELEVLHEPSQSEPE
jgi:hypothetical protein